MEIVRVKAEAPADFLKLVSIFREVFEQEGPLPSTSYLSGLLHNPDFLVFVAKEGEEVTGGLTAFVLHLYYEEKPVAYIYDLGVKPVHQGKGVGKALIEFFIGYAKGQGFSEAYVEAETHEEDVLRFYRKTSFSDELQATHFTFRFGEDEPR